MKASEGILGRSSDQKRYNVGEIYQVARKRSACIIRVDGQFGRQSRCLTTTDLQSLTST